MKHQYLSIVFFLSVSLVMGCASQSAGPVASSGSHAFVAAADESFFSVMSGEKSTTRLDAINGMATGAGRFNRGSGQTDAGPVALLVRLWGEQLLSGPSETYACIRFNAEAGGSYLVSSRRSTHQYIVIVSDQRSGNPVEIARYEVPYGRDARSHKCA